MNVANLGRRPYRSLSADVIGILQDDLRLLLRGEIIWVKQRGSSGSCAWGSFQKAGQPSAQGSDRTDDRGQQRPLRSCRLAAKDRAREGLPSESSMTREDFMENTLDVWEIPAESATPGRASCPVPGRAPGSADRAVHLPRRPGARSLRRLRDSCGGGRPVLAAITSAMTSTSRTSAWPRRGSKRNGRGSGATEPRLSEQT